jgi:hypothetical protein
MAVSPEVKLSIYNGALRHLGSRKLASLDEARKPRRVLDDIWGADNDVVRKALERGEWNFALRTVQAGYSESVEPGFGFKRAFDKPEDFCRLAALSADEYCRVPLTNDQFVDEATFWFSDLDVLFIRFVSSADDYGMNSAGWSQSFKDYLELDMAADACETITNSSVKRRELMLMAADALKVAKSGDAMNEGVKFFPRGGWSRSRSGFNRRGHL